MTGEEAMPQPASVEEIPCRSDLPVVAVDIGNARIKLGRFDAYRRLLPGAGPSDSPAQREQGSAKPGQGPLHFAQALPEPVATLSLDGVEPRFDPLAGWLGKAAHRGVSWWIGSVNRRSTTALLDWLRTARPRDVVTLLGSADLPLAVRVPEPDKVGVDRLLDAVAANALREPGCAAVVVDVGTAITVDLVAPDGFFCGGAILPGIGMSARALHEFTDLLPLVDMVELREPPPPVGATTIEAIRSGLFWLAVGAIRELITRMAMEQKPCPERPEPPEPHVFLTGGAGEAVAGLLGPRVRLVPHLTLAGIALTARAHAASE